LRPFDSSGEFRPATDGLRRLAVKGAAATLLSQALSLSIQVIATVVLARLLTPKDFGLVAMVTTFSLLLLNFGVNGFADAVLQRQDFNHALASNMFWITVGSGFLLTIGFAASGSLLAQFFHEPLVAPVAAAISLSIVITSAAVIHLALLMRAMRFSLVSANDVFARMVSVLVSVLLDRAGHGYWALVGGVVAQPLSQTLGAWILCRWLPGLPRRVDGTGSMVRFAIHVYGRFSLNYFARNTDNLLVGWRFSAQALGFYKKAYDLFALSFVMQSLTPVAVSALSRLSKQPEQYRRYLMSALSIAGFLGMGLGAAFTLIGHDTILLLLGPEWAPSGRIFSLFGPGIGAMFLNGIHGWIHLSLGRGDRWLRWGIIEFIITAALFLLLLPWGPAGIAAAWSISLWILTIPSLWYAGRPMQIGFGSMVSSLWKYVPASLIAAFITAAIARSLPAALRSASDPVGTLFRMVTVFGIFSGLYLGGVIVMHRGCAPIYQLVALLREMVPWNKLSKSAPVHVAPETLP